MMEAQHGKPGKREAVNLSFEKRTRAIDRTLGLVINWKSGDSELGRLDAGFAEVNKRKLTLQGCRLPWSGENTRVEPTIEQHPAGAYTYLIRFGLARGRHRQRSESGHARTEAKREAYPGAGSSPAWSSYARFVAC